MSEYSISVTAATYARLKAHAEKTRYSIASIVEEATASCVAPPRALSPVAPT